MYQVVSNSGAKSNYYDWWVSPYSSPAITTACSKYIITYVSSKDDKKDYVDNVNLAGFKKENITLKVKETSKGWYLATVKAVKGEGKDKQTKTHDIEIDAFKYNVKEISAKYEDGLLTVTIPRKVHPSTTIEIQ